MNDADRLNQVESREIDRNKTKVTYNICQSLKYIIKIIK